MTSSLPTANWEVRTVDVAGQHLRVSVTPSHLPGPPLLLCNGIGASLDVLTPFVDCLGGITAIAFDVPGTGGSPPSPVPLRMAGLARVVMALVDTLGHPVVDVLGVSWGGFLAQQLAHHFPERVRRLVLAATGAGGLVVPGKLSVLATLANPRRYRDMDHLVSVAGDTYGGAFRTHPELARQFLGKSRPPTTIGYFGQLYAIMGWQSILWLHRLRQPTLVLTGRDDPLCPPANGRLLAARIPHARLHLIDDGHLFLATSADSVGPLIRDFLLEEIKS